MRTTPALFEKDEEGKAQNMGKMSTVVHTCLLAAPSASHGLQACKPVSLPGYFWGPTGHVVTPWLVPW